MNMMNPIFWIPMSIGGICLLVIILVIIYSLSRSKNYDGAVNTRQQPIEKPPVRELNNADKTIQYCPDCGAKIQIINQEYCSLCGFKVKN